MKQHLSGDSKIVIAKHTKFEKVSISSRSLQTVFTESKATRQAMPGHTETG